MSSPSVSVCLSSFKTQSKSNFCEVVPVFLKLNLELLSANECSVVFKKGVSGAKSL